MNQREMAEMWEETFKPTLRVAVIVLLGVLIFGCGVFVGRAIEARIRQGP